MVFLQKLRAFMKQHQGCILESFVEDDEYKLWCVDEGCDEEDDSKELTLPSAG